MEDIIDIQYVLAKIRERVEFHKIALNKLEQQEAKIESELKAALNLLSEDKIASGTNQNFDGIITTGETPNLKTPKDAVLSAANELDGVFTLNDLYNKIIEKGIMIEGTNAYKRISAALIALAKSGETIKKVKYGKYKVI